MQTSSSWPTSGKRCVFWPEDLQRDGLFYGWSHPLICIAGVLGLESEEAEHALQNALSVEDRNRLKDFCGSIPSIMGRCVFSNQDSIAKSSPRVTPHLHFFQELTDSYFFVFYRRPNLYRLQIYTLTPDLTEFFHVQGQDGINSRSTSQSSPAVVEHDLTRPVHVSHSHLDPAVIHQMNYGQLFDRSFSSTKPPGETMLSPYSSLLVAKMKNRHYMPSKYQFTIVRLFHLLRNLKTTMSDGSAIIRQLDIRIAQVIEMPSKLPKIPHTRFVSTQSISEYVNFYNCVWLILNDIIIGWAVGSFICENSPAMAHTLDQSLRKLLVTDLQWSLLWLNNWPAGLKLNTELSQFLCHSLLGVVIAWNRILETFVLPHLRTALYASGAIGCCGMTMTISVMMDLLALLTAHVHLCYSVSCAIFRQQLRILSSLWNLFRGKRYNVLRNRTDSWNYDVDQLLFGTILFTLMAFLFPTVVAYYILFTTIRLFVILCHAALDVLLVLINQFPLFALLLHLKDPFRLPGGVVFWLAKDGLTGRLENKTLPLQNLFAHYGSFWAGFLANYHPVHLLRSILTARKITHIRNR